MPKWQLTVVCDTPAGADSVVDSSILSAVAAENNQLHEGPPLSLILSPFVSHDLLELARLRKANREMEELNEKAMKRAQKLRQHLEQEKQQLKTQLAEMTHENEELMSRLYDAMSDHQSVQERLEKKVENLESKLKERAGQQEETALLEGAMDNFSAVIEDLESQVEALKVISPIHSPTLPSFLSSFFPLPLTIVLLPKSLI